MTEAVQSHRWLPTQRRSLTPSPVVAYAIRFGVMVSASIWLGKAPGLLESHSTWILITVLMLGQPTTGASLLKGLLRAVGTVAAFFTAIGLFGRIPTHRFTRMSVAWLPTTASSVSTTTGRR